MAAARTGREKAGIWRSGVTTCGRSATPWGSPIRSSLAPRSAAWSRWLIPDAIRRIRQGWCSSAPKPSGADIEIAVWLCSNSSAVRKSARWRAAGSWRSKVTRIRPRWTPSDGWPSRSTRASHEIRTWRGVPSTARRSCNGSRNRAARATPSICSAISTASDVRPWYSVARTIPFTQLRAGRISRRRCRSIWCGSNGLRIAGTRW